MKRLAIVLLLLLALAGCTSPNAKEFMFQHPDLTFQLAPDGKVFDKYTTQEELNQTDFEGEILIFNVKGEHHELMMTDEFQTIPGTNYEVKAGCG